MSDAEALFIAEAIRHAYSLPLRDALKYIEGFSETVSTAHPAKPQLLAAHQHFNSGDAQLELIATGQLVFKGLVS